MAASSPCCATAPTTASAMTCGAMTSTPANGGCWWIRRSSASGRELSEAEKMQRERARDRRSQGDRHLSLGERWYRRSWCRSMAICFSPELDGTVTRLTDTEGTELNPSCSAPRAASSRFVRDRRLWVGPVGGEAAAGHPGRRAPKRSAGARPNSSRRRKWRGFTGYWWSPDDSRIAVQRIDDASVGIVTRAAIGAKGTKIFDSALSGWRALTMRWSNCS